MSLRRAIAAALGIGALLIVVLAVAGALWGILTAVGDVAAAEGVRGIALVVLVCLALDVLTLVTLTALGQLAAPPDELPRSDDE